MRTLLQAAEFGMIAGMYARERATHPCMRALTIFRWLRDDQGLTLEQFECATERGHSWSFTGTAYGGDDSSYMGEGRCYCAYCGADGDA